jgi:flagellar biosynthesis chaperone FliJ
MAKSVTIDFNANLTRFTNSVDKATNQLSKFERNATRISKTLKRSFVGLAAALPVAAIGVAVSRIADSADKIGKLSTRLGASTEALSELKFAAELSGVSFETLTMGLQRMTRRIAEAAQGTGEAKNALKELGLSAQELSRLAPEDQFEAIADAINGLGSDSDKVRLSMKLFDSEGVALIQTMDGGAKAIREMRKEAQELGLSLSQEDVNRAAEFNDAWTRLSATFEGAAQAIAIEMLQTLTELADTLRDELAPAIREVLEFFDLIEPKAVKIRSVEKELASATQGLEALKNALTFNEEAGNTQAIEAVTNAIAKQTDNVKELQKQLDILNGTYKAPPREALVSGSGAGTLSGDRKKDSAPSKAAKEAEAFAKALRALQDELDPVSAKTRDYLENVALLDRAWAEGQISGEQYGLLMTQLATDTEAVAEAERALNADRKKAVGFIKDLDPGSAIRDQIIEVQRLRDTFPELSDALAEVELDLQDKWDSIGSQAEEAAQSVDDAWQDLGPTFASAFEDAIVAGESLRDVLDGLEQDIIRIITRTLVTEPLGNALAGLFSGIGGGFDITNIFSSLFGGFRASGGSIDPSKFYMVGENGPELFVSKTAGDIIPASPTTMTAPTPSGRNGSTVININMSNMSGDDVRRSGGQVAAQVARAVSRAQRRDM